MTRLASPSRLWSPLSIGLLVATVIAACTTDPQGLDPNVQAGGGSGGRGGAIDAPVAGRAAKLEACTKPARPKALGDACACAAECGSGFCADGLCCSSACEGTCQSCKVSGRVGTCAPVPAGVAPRTPAQCRKEAVSTCGLDGTCDGSGACRKYPDETVCGPGKCDGGQVVGQQVCEAGSCKPGGTIVCAPFACDGDRGACFDRCGSDGQCAAGKKCEAASCGKKPLGARCEQATECDSGSCADGVCCSTACDGGCTSCALAGHRGECTPVARGAIDPHGRCTDRGAASCDTSGACNGMGGCEKYAAGTVCRPATCSGGSLMPAGTCDGRGVCLPGEPVPCAPFACRGNSCLDACSGQADCVAPAQCTAGSCGKRGLGQQCAKATDCSSGFCADGVCCNEACGGRCRSCALPTSLGRCVNVPADQADPRAAAGDKDPARVCLDGGVASCGYNGRCNGAGDCQKYSAGATCKAESCNAGTNAYTGASTCDGVGRCVAGTSRACAPFRCNGTRCGTTCGSDASCASGNVCRDGSCGKSPDGALCTRDDVCASGHCEQGVCCSAACTGSCFSCALPATRGTCTAVPNGGLDPQGGCNDQGAASCGSDGTCNGSGRCRVYAGGTVCAAAACTEGRAKSASTCNGSGSCVAGSTRACAPYLCNAGGTTCFESCSDDSHCAAPNKCIGGRCGKKSNGAVCREAGECVSNLCVDGVCCDTACDGVCVSCALAGTLGKCSPLTAGASDGRCVAADVSTCGNDGFCDGKGGCRKWRVGSVCRGAACPAGTSAGTKAATCAGTGAACPAGAAASCGLFLCDAPAGTCKASCTPASQTADCAASATCTSIGGVMTCGLKPQGSSCNGAGECAMGLACVDGTCCGTASCGACQSCANAAGVCQPIGADEPDPRCASKGDVCGTTGKCTAEGACQLAPSGTGCGAVCSNDGRQLQDRRCNGAGVCVAHGDLASCNAYVCKAGACLQRCAADADCATGNVCRSGQCGPGRKANGSSCSQDDECTSANCVDGTCCTTATCGACSTCANAAGACAPVADGAADPDSCPVSAVACGTTGKCDGAGRCRLVAAGTACGGTAAVCAAGVLTRSACDGAGACLPTVVGCNGFACANATTCRTSCTGNGHCAAGKRCDRANNRCE